MATNEANTELLAATLPFNGWSVETSSAESPAQKEKTCNKGKDGSKPKASSTPSRYHGYWEKQELCFAFKHFQETDKYIEQYRQEKFRIQESYYKDALTKVHRQHSVLEDLLCKTSSRGACHESSEKLDMAREDTSSHASTTSRQSTLIQRPKHEQITAPFYSTTGFQGCFKSNKSRQKTGLLWKRSVSDPALNTVKKPIIDPQNESNWTVIGVEKRPFNTHEHAKERRDTACRSAPPRRNTAASLYSLRQNNLAQRTSKLWTIANKNSKTELQEKRRQLHINTLRRNKTTRQPPETKTTLDRPSTDRTRDTNTPTYEVAYTRRPVIRLNNLGDTLITGVAVGSSDPSPPPSTPKQTRQSGLYKERSPLGYISSKSDYTDLFKHVISNYRERIIETDPKLLSVKNF